MLCESEEDATSVVQTTVKKYMSEETPPTKNDSKLVLIQNRNQKQTIFPTNLPS